jgi:two-component system, LytTR family, sensor kinase
MDRFEPSLTRWHPAAAVLLLFWLTEYAVVTTVDHIAAASAFLFLPRVLIALGGFSISFALLQLRPRGRQASLLARSLAMFLLALIGTVAHVMLTYAIFRRFAPEMRGEITLIVFLMDFARWMWVYLAQFGIIFSLDLAFVAIARERQIAALSKAGHEAQMRALRYQLSPHFLFNTLNSLAALVGRKDNQAAETMIENLADFMRVSLAIRPDEEISLAEELTLTRHYLSIEEVRFPERIRSTFHVDGEAARGRVPGLMLQPLVENVVRHAVAQSREIIDLRIAAQVKADQLVIEITNSLPASPPGTKGFGIGLANVRERLEAHFGDAAQFDAGVNGDQFIATARMPLQVLS